MIHWLRNVPFSILAACVLISVIGLFGLQRADELYGASRLFERQLIWISLAWPAMLAVTVVSYRPLRHLSPWLYVGSLLLLVVVLFMPPINGSRRWIPLGLFDFQPSEPARLAFILALAHYLMHRDSQKTVRGLLPPFVMTMLPLLLILREPDLGTAMLFLPILYAMLFVAGARPTHLLVAALIGVAMLPLMWQQMSREQKSRVVMVFNQTDGGLAPSGDGFHLHQSKQVFALGGLWGSVSRDEPIIDDPSAYILPAARTDFILSVIAERYGVAGAAVLLLLYGVIVVRGLAIAKRTKEPFGRLAAVGIVTMIATQALINASMTVGLMPITGITLPMCSYGGSSLLSTCIAMGLLMNVAMHPGYEVAG
ncbi:MAG: rod shape-determining protein RodA [Fuerstiella sp.]|nr:rod shape-determining protein RodA [Fuerstiella sp.]MCP4784728.1 rod shape-determining protein RodA [Fuerstiella sp.]MCP4853452.1 rod shape-determining protein RodA [Fuerstiella sp.]